MKTKLFAFLFISIFLRAPSMADEQADLWARFRAIPFDNTMEARDFITAVQSKVPLIGDTRIKNQMLRLAISARKDRAPEAYSNVIAAIDMARGAPQIHKLSEAESRLMQRFEDKASTTSPMVSYNGTPLSGESGRHQQENFRKEVNRHLSEISSPEKRMAFLEEVINAFDEMDLGARSRIFSDLISKIKTSERDSRNNNVRIQILRLPKTTDLPFEELRAPIPVSVRLLDTNHLEIVDVEANVIITNDSKRTITNWPNIGPDLDKRGRIREVEILKADFNPLTQQFEIRFRDFSGEEVYKSTRRGIVERFHNGRKYEEFIISSFMNGFSCSKALVKAW